MAIHVGDLAKGPALGDFIERVGHQRRSWLVLAAVLGLAFVLVAVLAPMVGLLLLSVLLMVGAAAWLYSRREVKGHGRLAVQRGQRR